MRKQSLRRGRSAIVRAAMLSICLATLSGCATKPPLSAVNCPERPPIPAHLAEPSLPSARAYSQEVRSYLSEVQTSLRKWQQTRMPSSQR